MARGSASPISTTPPVGFDEVTKLTTLPPQPRRRFGALLYLLSIVVIGATVTAAGARMWREARQHGVPIPAAVASVADGRLELSADRRAIARIAADRARWMSTQPAAVDTIEVTGGLVLGRTSGALVAIDLDSGNTRFTWAMPAGERWGVQPPTALGSCLLTISVHGDDAFARCIDVTTGVQRWLAKISGGRECRQPPLAVPGAYLVQCPGWTTVIDDHDGTVNFDAGGVGLVQRDPPILLRGGARPSLAPWSAKHFTHSGTVVRGALDAASSAVLHGGRVVERASSASTKLAVIAPKTGLPIVVSVSELQLADDTPLVLDCGGGTSPRFQLLELAPRPGATFDSSTAQNRVFALLDVEAGRIAWTSNRIVPVQRAGAAVAPICLHGQYFVPIELHDDTNLAVSALWIVDAESGTTSAAFAFDASAETSFAELTADQIGADRIVGVNRRCAYELRWQPGGALPDVLGLYDARPTLQRLLGRLP